MILITGAAGQTGIKIIKKLLEKKCIVRGLAFNQQGSDLLNKIGAQEVIVGDMRDSGAMEKATKGIKTVYHICPVASPDEVLIGKTAIEAANKSGVKEFIFHSALHAQIEKMPHHWRKMRVEEMLFESDLQYAIIRPTMLMQNVLIFWNSIMKKNVYPMTYSKHIRFNMVDLDDVAEVAAKVITEGDHFGATYELCGTEILTSAQMVQIMSDKMGRDIRYQVLSIDEWESFARSALNDAQIETLKKMFEYYNQHGIWGNSKILEWLLGRKPTTFAQFIERTLKEEKSGV